MGDYKQALENHMDALQLQEELGDKRSIASTLHNLGHTHHYLGQYETALEYYKKAKEIRIQIEDKKGLSYTLLLIGIIHQTFNQPEKARELLETSLEILEDIGITKGGILLDTIAQYYILKKQSNEKYDKSRLLKLLKETDEIDFSTNLTLYHLLDDKSFLQSAKKQIEQLADNLSKPDEFLNLPIPKAIENETKNIQSS